MEYSYSTRRSYSLSFTLNADADVIEWLDAQPNKTHAIRELVREKINKEDS